MEKATWQIGEVENDEFKMVAGLIFEGRIIKAEYYTENGLMHVKYKIIGDQYYNCTKTDDICKIVDLCHRLEKVEHDMEESIERLKKETQGC